MEKKDFTNNKLISTLVNITLKEYQNIKVLFKFQDILKKVNYKKGNEISCLKGLIIVPELFLIEHYAKGGSQFYSVEKIREQGLEDFIVNIIPKDNATIIGKSGIAYGFTLETTADAEKVMQHLKNNPEFTITDILRMYSSKNTEDIGQRERITITAHVLLKGQDVLRELYKESPERFESLKEAFEEETNKFKESTSYHNVKWFYNGEIICKMQTAASNSTLTGPIKVFHPNDGIGESVEFKLVSFRECSDDIKERYSRKKTILSKYVKKADVPKKDFIFDDGINNDPIVGLLQMYKYDPEQDRAKVYQEFLIQPQELHIKTNVTYTPVEKFFRLVKRILPRKK